MSINQIHIINRVISFEESMNILCEIYMDFNKKRMKTKLDKDKLLKTEFDYVKTVNDLSSSELKLFVRIYFLKREESLRRKPNENDDDYFIRQRDLIIDKLKVNLKFDDTYNISKPAFFKSVKRLVDERILVMTDKQSIYYINPYIIPILTLEEFNLFKMKIEDYFISKHTTLLDKPQPL